jgi:large-conductance mechanosensitive channel
MSDLLSTTAKKRQNLDSTFKVSPFEARGFGVQQKAAESAPLSKAQLWENYEQAKQLNQNGANISNPTTLPIQTKLSIGPPGDKYEQEADSNARQVMAMPEPKLATSIVTNSVQTRSSIQPIQRACTDCQEETKEESKPGEDGERIQAKSEYGQIPELTSIQRKLNSDDDARSSSNLEDRLNRSKGGGSPLSNDVRSFMEPRFGADFSGVRVHTGSDAVQMNRDVNAQAFAHGSDIYFGAGKSPGNNELTAHELTHVVQQTGGVQTKQTFNKPDVQLKCAACDEEEKVHRSIEISAVSGMGVQRSWFGDEEDEKKEPENSSGGGVLDWAKDKASGAVDSVTQAGGDAVDWAKEKGSAAVDTVTQAGGDAVDWAKEKGEQYSNELFVKKKASVIAQISQAMQKIAGQDFVYLSSDRIATLNGHLAALSEKSQGSIALPGIAAQTDSTDSTAPPGTEPIAASAIESLLQNLQASLSTPFMSSPTSDLSDSGNSEIAQGKIQRVAFAGAAPVALGLVALQALGIILIIVAIIYLAVKIKDFVKEKEREKEREKEEENKRRPPPDNICNKAIKVLEQYERLAKKLNKKIPPKRLEELNRMRDAGTITSNDLPGFLEFPGGELVGMTLEAIRKLCGKK